MREGDVDYVVAATRTCARDLERSRTLIFISPEDSRRRAGEVMQRTRIRCGLTQANLGELLHVGQTTVSKWERGVTPFSMRVVNPLVRKLRLPEPVRTALCVDIYERLLRKVFGV